jgi:hypothetical protein
MGEKTYGGPDAIAEDRVASAEKEDQLNYKLPLLERYVGQHRAANRTRWTQAATRTSLAKHGVAVGRARQSQNARKIREEQAGGNARHPVRLQAIRLTVIRAHISRHGVRIEAGRKSTDTGHVGPIREGGGRATGAASGRHLQDLELAATELTGNYRQVLTSRSHCTSARPGSVTGCA